ncbi:NADPH:quinone reductase-like Zn-dependent oxidoreductase [Nocardia tenerifensis]|uniref:NADPH:quinone reductase-like Zn-dependent oxidoreductase n=3 Tax=Nocardia tenerifensis TaxID=228006 RepID=A0A318JUR7_9NOCA|nr:NADP-dependent oxidoreductase [Nocardia tenerifensis]PXX59193.1 NADPH:quinone reductase-like Zn-dependent oxidoreductase [Nocardia tenerifensis]
MLAITQRAYGGPEVLEETEVERPRPGAGEVLVRVAATSINAADWKLRSGQLGEFGSMPLTLGLDVSGVVEELGPGVFEFQVGEAVYGVVLGGANAEYVVVRAHTLGRKPAGIDHEHAAALPAAASSAWQALAAVGAGQRVLVHAAAGGVGHLAVQIAKHRGAHVVATARAVNHEYLRDLGADEVIDYTATDFAEAVRDIDLVLDLVGGAYGTRSLRVLRPNGRYIDLQGSDAEGDPRYERFYVEPAGVTMREISTMVERGLLRVTIDQVLPIADIAKAHRLSESGGVRGKIVVTAWNSLS